jgi:hypothetical protein
MNIRITTDPEHQRQQAGSVLVVSLVTTAILGIALASYLTLVRAQNLSVMRSLAWNSCIPVAEAGIEEAMTHLNLSGISNLESSGWVLGEGGYTKRRSMGDSYFVATISTDNPPDITSDGFVPVPLSSAAPLAFVASLVTSDNNVNHVRRRVRVTTRRDGMWVKGMVARGNIDLMGNGITTDSFDSEDPNSRIPVPYDRSRRRDRGDVATNSGIINSHAQIYGSVATGPSGSLGIGPQGAVGDIPWHDSGNKGIKPGHYSNDMNVFFPDVERPNLSYSAPTSGTVDGVSYAYMLGNPANPHEVANYSMADLSLSGSQVMYVASDVVLLVTRSISITGNGQIVVAPGANLKLYMEGANASIAGNGVLNHNATASSFLYFGLPTNTSLTLGGNAGFTGAIYAPNADFSMGGGGSDTYDFVGASVTNTVRMNGHFNFHYDEALGRSKWSRGYIVNSWNEI